MSPYLDLNRDLTSTQVALKEQAHRFAKEVLRPASTELDKLPPEQVTKEDSALWKVFRLAYEQGFHVSGFPEQLGGAGLGPLEQHIAAEEMGWGCAGIANGLAVTAIPFAMALMSGNRDLINEFFVPFSQDREAKYIGCVAVTEPHHGSDWMLYDTEQFRDPSITSDLRGVRDGEDWIIKGQKSAWVSNGTIATHALLFLGLDRSQGMAGSGAAIVPLDLPGVSKGPPLDKLGLRAMDQGEIYFDDVRIPKHYMMAESEQSVAIMDAVVAGAGAGMGATYTGLARAAFEEALTYCKQRVQGGKPIAEHQLVQRKLFDMFTKVETARAISRAAMLYNAGAEPPQTHYSVASKVYCTEVAFSVASDAVQLFGGYGLCKEVLVEKLFRDARASLMEIGTNEVLSLAAARLVVDRY
jgi:alkylation response protein AidB-like acyl-CoA dehydrogenase